MSFFAFFPSSTCGCNRYTAAVLEVCHIALPAADQWLRQHQIKLFPNCSSYSTLPTITTAALIDQINVLHRVTSVHMIRRSHVHGWTEEFTQVSTHTHTWLASEDSPCSGAPVPLWCSALWYHAGQIFLSAWMAPWHGVYLDWQLVFYFNR